MDPHSSAQDVPRCDLCETAIVHSYCDFCHVNLCTPCIGKHISDGYDKHKIVPFQERRSTLIYPKCGTHQHKNCDLQCKDCNILICSSCTASKQHKGHHFVEVTEVYNEKKENIKKDTKELENHISPTYEEIAMDLEKQLANLDGGYEKLKTTMSKQGEQWHREIDIIINKMKTEIGEIKIKHRDILKKHLFRTEFRKLPPKVQVSLPTFIPKPIDRDKLYSLFGHITPLSTAPEEHVLSLNQSNTSARQLDEPEVVATIKTGHEKLCSVTCLNEDKIWMSGLTNDIKSFNIEGVLLQTIKLTQRDFPNDIAIDGDRNLLYTSGATRTVNTVKNGQTEVLITLQGWVPLNLCVTSTGDLLVSMYSDDETQSKVVRYLGSTEIQTIQYDKEGKPLYSGNASIKYITENRNHYICVADWEACAVVVVNQDGKLKWRYTGHPSVTKNKQFKPWGIATDSQRHILTADSFNNCIHVLDKNGQFFWYIENCDLENPFGLCVDNNDSLFVCQFMKGNVTKIKYLR